MTELTEYRGEEARAVSLIQSFWKEHNGYNMPPEEAKEDLAAWTASGHAFYFICREQEPVGFLHLGSRGGKVDWLEDLFVLPTCQNQGIGSEAVRLAEEIVKAYSESMYIEAAPETKGPFAFTKGWVTTASTPFPCAKTFPAMSTRRCGRKRFTESGLRSEKADDTPAAGEGRQAA